MYGAYVETAAYNQSWGSNDSMPSVYNDALNWLSADIPDSYGDFSVTNRSEVKKRSTGTDFVIVCEVSEIEGPKPLFTIPQIVQVDCNKLAERMMSVDYYCGNSNPFARSADTQVVLSHVIDGYHALINYFVLYDISARGFVRPVCVAYITRDKNKLFSHFEELRNGFLEISKYFKFGNRQLFKEELSQYLDDLQLAKDNYCRTCNLEPTKPEKLVNNCAPSNEVISDQPKRRLIPLDPLLTSFCLINPNEEVEEDEEQSIEETPCDDDVKSVDDVYTERPSRSVCKELASQRSIESSTIDHFASSIIEAQHLLSPDKPILDDAEVAIIFGKVKTRIETQYNKSLYQYIKSFVLAGPVQSPKLLPSSFHLKLSEMRSIFKLCSWGIVIGLDLLISLQKHFQRSSLNLYMDNEGLKFMEPESGLFLLNNNVTGMSSLDSINELSHYSLPNSNWEYPLDTERNLSELRTLFLTIDQKDCFRSCKSLTCDFDDMFHDVEEPLAMSQSPITYCTLEEYNKQLDEIDFDRQHSNLSTEYLESSDQSVMSESIDTESFLSVESRRNSDVSAMEQEFSRFAQGRRFSVDASVCSIEAYNNRAKAKSPPVAHGSIMSRVGCLTSDKSGYGIATTFCRFNCLPHVLYSLLIGRPVIIVGSPQNEELVRATVQALDLFVPSKKRFGSVVPWHSGSLDAKDLCRIKLVGVFSKDGKIEDELLPVTSLPHVSILGVTKETYQGPLYSGTNLSSLFRVRKSGWDDASFISLLFSLLLSLTASLALNNQQTSSGGESVQRRTRDFLLSNLQLSKDDANIVKYLIDLQTDESDNV